MEPILRPGRDSPDAGGGLAPVSAFSRPAGAGSDPGSGPRDELRPHTLLVERVEALRELRVLPDLRDDPDQHPVIERLTGGRQQSLSDQT